jgi:Flp pilus assembly protein TadG
MQRLRRTLASRRRRAVTIVLVAVMVPVLLGFAVLTIDVGVLYNSRADLQNAADAGALSATDILGSDKSIGGVTTARAQAIAMVHSNYSLGRQLAIDPTDIVFGKIDYDPDTNTFSFFPTETLPDAVRISVRSTTGSANGPVPLFFASIFGKPTANVAATATAALTSRRDIAVIVDLSGSMKFDSDLRFYKTTPINLRDIWASLDGPEPSRPYIPGAENQTEYASDTGPTIGVMNTWGTPVTTSYNPTTDPGLWYIPNNKPCTLAAVIASLTARGYTAGQRNTLMNSSSATTWPNRVAVMTGLAKWTPSGGSDTTVGSSELTWIPYPSYRKTWTWPQYIDWVKGNNNNLVSDFPAFKFRFGVKTYVDFLLDRKYSFSETDLTKTPEEPMRSVKDGVQEFVNFTRSFDNMSLEVFATTARHEKDLSDDRQATADRLYAMQPNYYDASTNIGAGIQQGINELTGSRARENAEKMIVLLSDGASNTGPDPLSVAQDAADLGIRIHTISVGYGADRVLMQAIAALTDGQEYYAQGTPEQYTAQLRLIFRNIGGLGNAELIE